MNKAKKIAIIVVIVGATVAGLIFYATKSKPVIVEQPKTDVISQNQAPQPVKPAPASDQLPPLPADSKQAIAAELQGINDSIQSVDSALSADVEDGELGL
ncbi:MAG: hypothetical protein ACD_5C00347G0007 [uncultured bacterium]|nr:MAG: hypothetical protein ACD_5C00347G0007 [uncultured bacterium]